MPTPPAPHGPPVPFDSSWSFSTDRAVVTQFCPPGESVSLCGIVSNSLTRRIPADVTRSFSNNYLPSAFVAHSQNSRRDVWIGDSGASCHMANGTSKMNTCPTALYTAPQSDQQANCFAISPGDYASSSAEHEQQMPPPPAPHGPPVPSDSSWSFSTDRAVVTQFCPPGESVSLRGSVSNSLTRRIPADVTRSSSNNYLPSAFVAHF